MINMETNKSQLILVTGGAGYIGSAVVHSLIKAGYGVVIFDDLSTGQKSQVHAKAEFIQGDLLDTKILNQLFSDYDFAAVIHSAGKKAVRESEAEPAKYFRNNVLGTLNLLDAMSKGQVPQLIFSSTASVYRSPKVDQPVSENDPLDPVSVYGQSKLMAEILIKDYARLGRLKRFVILRYFNVAGDVGLNYHEDKAENIFPILARALNQGETFNIFGNDFATKDGTGVRDYIHLSDLVDAHLKALTHTGQSILNLGTKTGYSVRELVTAFEKLSGKNIKVVEAPRRAGDPAIVIANASKAQVELNWQPTHNLDDMVRSVLAVYGLNQF